MIWVKYLSKYILLLGSNYWTTKNLVFEFLYFYDLATYLNDLAT